MRLRDKGKIRRYWDSQAKKHGSKIEATMPDVVLKEMEIANIAKYIKPWSFILDAGCGNGYSMIMLSYAAITARSIRGIDYSPDMIKQAKERIKPPELVEVMDITKLSFKANSFDCVYTDRCLINLPTSKDQVKAIKEIHHVLKEQGTYIMCEDTQQGLAKLNTLRALSNLPPIKTRWHNLYIDEVELLKSIDKLFSIDVIDNFSSTYYLITRVIYANTHKGYDVKLNKIASRMPNFGDYSPLKIFVLRKK